MFRQDCPGYLHIIPYLSDASYLESLPTSLLEHATSTLIESPSCSVSMCLTDRASRIRDSCRECCVVVWTSRVPAARPCFGSTTSCFVQHVEHFVALGQAISLPYPSAFAYRAVERELSALGKPWHRYRTTRRTSCFEYYSALVLW